MDKLEEQEMNKIRSIKQNAMREKPKIIRDKLKDKKINDMWALLDAEKKQKIEKKEAKWKNN